MDEPAAKAEFRNNIAEACRIVAYMRMVAERGRQAVEASRKSIEESQTLLRRS